MMQQITKKIISIMIQCAIFIQTNVSFVTGPNVRRVAEVTDRGRIPNLG